MNDEQLPFAKTAITRIVMEKIPRAKRWSVSKEFKAWIESLSKAQFEAYLDRLRTLTGTLSDEGHSDQEMPKKTGTFILFGAYSLSEAQKMEQIAQTGGEATAYYALALWRSIQVEELRTNNVPKLTAR